MIIISEVCSPVFDHIVLAKINGQLENSCGKNGNQSGFKDI